MQCGFVDEDCNNAAVVWDGLPEVLVHGPSMYLDEVLLRDRKHDAARFLDEVEAFFRALQDSNLGDLPRLDVYLLELDDPTEYNYPYVVTTRLLPTFQAKSTFEPKLRAPRMLYPAFWAYWNHFANTAGDEAAVQIRDNLVYQCEWYRANGFKYRKLGQAVVYASQRGAGDRLSAEIGAMAGLTAEEFRELPEHDRNRLIEEHTRRSVEAAFADDADSE